MGPLLKHRPRPGSGWGPTQLVPANAGVIGAVHVYRVVEDHGLVRTEVAVLQPTHGPVRQRLECPVSGLRNTVVEEAPARAEVGAERRDGYGRVEGERGVRGNGPVDVQLVDL